jgi:hypothetical protein
MSNTMNSNPNHMEMERSPPVAVCVSDIHRQTNERIYDRNIPSQPLQPYIDVRPVMTKYSHFPIVDPRKSISVPLQQMPTYNVGQVFNPGNAAGPWSGFATNVNAESELRNQVYALQKCSQAVYVPNSNSDLYSYSFQTVTQPNPHSLLFQSDSFASFNPNPAPGKCGYSAFNNNTRVQVRDLTKQTA